MEHPGDPMFLEMDLPAAVMEAIFEILQRNRRGFFRDWVAARALGCRDDESAGRSA
jgi:hypothetical protein